MNLIVCTGLKAKVDRTIDHQAGCVAQEDLPGGVARHVEDAGLRFEAPQLSPRLALAQ